jgi:hypothetical protein
MPYFPPKRLLLAAFLLLWLGACVEDPDESFFPDPAAQYHGTWQVKEETGFSAPQSYTMTITEDTSAQGDILIKGLYNVSGTAVSATVNGTDINLPNQRSEGIQFFGYGTANEDFTQLDLQFTANDGAGPDEVRAQASR